MYNFNAIRFSTYIAAALFAIFDPVLILQLLFN